ncbi:uncharacterized protein LOC111171915 [Delphinapterus leucas]|uniref:Uncharacterized protein LOC111171915 n=1 Tax=Delphinapterus leucas TaxID=9749 RepID=A0A7F8K993_DELLE|nr:uncharacterized protein LOC111171915 [Delphinapterus leucas]
MAAATGASLRSACFTWGHSTWYNILWVHPSSSSVNPMVSGLERTLDRALDKSPIRSSNSLSDGFNVYFFCLDMTISHEGTHCTNSGDNELLEVLKILQEVYQGPEARWPEPLRSGSDSYPGPHSPVLPAPAADAPTPPAPPQNRGKLAGEHGASGDPAAGPWAPRRRGRGSKAPRGGRAAPADSRAGAAAATRENGGSPGAGDGPGQGGGSRAGVRASKRVGPGVTHGAGPGGSLSASASSPSPSSAAAASGCSLGPRGAAWALGPSVVFRPLLLPVTGSRGSSGGCASGRRPRGSRGGRRTAALARLLRLRLCCGAPHSLRPAPEVSVSPRPRRSPLPARARL